MGIAIVVVACFEQVDADTVWDIKVGDGNSTCDLVAYSIQGVDESFGDFLPGFFVLADSQNVPGHRLPKGKPILVIRTGPEPGHSLDYLKPDTVEVNGYSTQSYQWNDGGEWEPVFHFIAGENAIALFEASREEQPLTIRLASAESEDRTVLVSTDRETSFPVLAEMLETCGRALSASEP